MSYNKKNEKITCRVAIQVCIGHFPDGRERHRTFSMKGINPDASPEAIAAVIRALAPVLAYPITKVRKITKKVKLIYEEKQEDAEPETRRTRARVISFPVHRRSARRRKALTGGAVLPFSARVAQPRRFRLSSRGEGGARPAGFHLGRSPPGVQALLVAL